MKNLCLGLMMAALACTGVRGEEEGPKMPPLKVCMLSGSAEYKSDESLGAFKPWLEARYNVACTLLSGKDGSSTMPGIEALDSSDLMLVFMRRISLAPDQLARVKKHCRAGKPVIGLRTASHGFQNWLEFDKEVLGGNYKGHYGAGPITEVKVAEKAKDHPILTGLKPFTSTCSLYKNTGAAEAVELLMTGTIPGHTEPLAWTRVQNGGRVFCTSLGGPDDFKNENFRRLIVNAIFWTAKRAVEATSAAAAIP